MFSNNNMSLACQWKTKLHRNETVHPLLILLVPLFKKCVLKHSCGKPTICDITKCSDTSPRLVTTAQLKSGLKKKRDLKMRVIWHLSSVVATHVLGPLAGSCYNYVQPLNIIIKNDSVRPCESWMNSEKTGSLVSWKLRPTKDSKHSRVHSSIRFIAFLFDRRV